jgi:SAM-dependent methyltransferase
MDVDAQTSTEPVREPVPDMTGVDAIPLCDFNLFLHELRSRRLAHMPAGADVVLSGGAAGNWYFDWFAERYPSPVKRHIGVEYFSAPPDPLPDGVEWLARTLGDLSPVGDQEVDLVFAGQVIEHLWPADIAGFLGEANRVLSPDGVVVIDSPTRFITDALAWTQPEHTIEFEVDEINELLQLAGFTDIEVKGVWLCYDRTHARVLPLDIDGGGEDWPWKRRVVEAEARPHDSFIWWAEARKGAAQADRIAIGRRVRQIYERARPTYFDRMRSDFEPAETDSSGRFVRAARGQTGFLLRGPSIAMPPGRHLARFRLRAEADDPVIGPNVPVAHFAATRDGGHTVAKLPLTARDLPSGGAEREVALSFECVDTAFDCELRLRSTGAASLVARLPAEVDEQVADRPRHPVRPLARDPAALRARVALTRLGRGAAWPARRLLDPRLAGLRGHIDWASWNIVQRLDLRTAELGARVDALAQAVSHPAIASTRSERVVELPFILAAVGGVEPGSTVLVSDSLGSAPASLLASLGYDIVTTTTAASAVPVAAAVLRTNWLDAAELDRVGAVVRGGGVIAVIASEGPDRDTVRRMLAQWDASVHQTGDETIGPILASARLPDR